jgi:CheY-like chemotaxis protein
MDMINGTDRMPVTIVLVEDDDGDAKAVQRAFKKAKIANPIRRAIDGMDALALLRGTEGQSRLPPPYVLLVDLNMPRMSGIQLVEQIRQDPDLRRAIVFILTTSKCDDDKAAAYDLNVAGYIVKEKAGDDFLNLIAMIDSFWRIVEMPV